MTIRELKNKEYKFFLDSREVQEGSVFVAIQGERVDGHNYVNSSFDKGAEYAIVEKDGDYKGKTIKLDNIQNNFLKTTSELINENAKMKIAVTGSTGKTTTKELLYHALFPSIPTFRTLKNYNTEIGIPTCILNDYEYEDVVILEMGLRKEGDIKLLSDIYTPDVAFVTNAGSSHIEFLKTEENIAREKMEITSGMKKGLLIINGDQEILKKYYPKHLNILTFGKNETNNGYLVDFAYSTETTKVWFVLHGKEVMLTLKDHWSEGQLIDLIAVLTFTTFIEIPMDPYHLYNFAIPSGRFKCHTLKDKVLIDDSYNASFDSFSSGFESVKKFDESLSKTLLMGEMRELGDKSDYYHEKVIEKAKTVFNKIYFYDPEKVHRNLEGVIFIENMEEIGKAIEETTGLIYVKASNGTGINAFLKDYLK